METQVQQNVVYQIDLDASSVGPPYAFNPGVPIALESARFQPLNLSSEKLVSSLCFFEAQLVPLQLGGPHHGGAPVQVESS
jgi:hypothetical protein